MVNVVIFDGGFGTTLSRPPFNINVSEIPLWSSGISLDPKYRENASQILKDVYTSFMRSGSQIVSSGTYQSYVPCFIEALKSGGESKSDLNAVEEKARFLMQQPITILFESLQPGVTPCISLGPLGAFCSPGQEYDGKYPAPFGKGSSKDIHVKLTFEVENESHVRFSNDEDTLTNLTLFHLSRLESLDLTECPSEKVILAFETVPNLEEITAIRQAMHGFLTTHRNLEKRLQWFISVPLSPESVYRSAPHLTGEDLSNTFIETVFAGDLPRPWGFGLNCTHPDVVVAFEKALTNSMIKFEGENSQVNKPWLILYPDGGLMYDVISRQFSGDPLSQKQFASCIQRCIENNNNAASSPWAGIVAGGCCNTDPSHIHALSKLLTQ